MVLPSRRALLGLSLAAIPAGLAAGVWWRQRNAGLDALDVRNPEPLLAALAASPWVGPMTGAPILWTVGFRGCPWCTAFERTDALRLDAAGVDLRSFVFPPTAPDTGRIVAPPHELSVLATLYQTRDKELFRAWFAADDLKGFVEARGLPPLDAIPGGEAAVAAAARLSRRLEKLFAAETARWGYPAFIWRKGEKVRAAFGYRRHTAQGLARELGVVAT